MQTRGITIAIGADTKEFQKGLKSMDREIKKTNQEVDTLAKSLELNYDSKRFESAQAKAQEVISFTNDKAKALKERLAFLEQSEGVDSDSYRKLQNELVMTEAKAVLLTKKFEELKAIRIEELAGKFDKVGNSIGAAAKAITPFSAAAAGILGSFAAIGLSAVKAGDDIATTASQLNLTAESMQKWQYIAMQTDVSNSELETAFRKTQSALADLATGAGGKTAEALQRLGISMGDASKGMESNIDVIIDRLSSIEDPVLQAAYANELFGERMGSKLIPLLKSGSDGLAQLKNEFESVGYMSNEQVQKLAEFDNVMNRIKKTLANFKNEIGIALLPVMQTIADIVENRVIPAVQKMTNWINALSDRQKNMLIGTLAVIAALTPILIVLSKLSLGVGSVIRSFGSMQKVMTLIATHPIIAIIGVVVGLMAILYKTNEEFRASINNLFSSIQEIMMPIFDILSKTMTELASSVMPLFNTVVSSLAPILTILINLFMNVLQAVTPLFSAFQTLLVPIMSILITVITQLMNVIVPLINILISSLMPVINMITNAFTPIINMIVKALVPVIEYLGKVWSNVFGFMPKVIDTIMKALEKFINNGIELINSLIMQINKLGQVLGFTIKELDKVSLSGKLDTSIGEAKKIEAPNTAVKAESAIKESASFTPQSLTNINNDYSNKNIKVEVIVQNYADKIDVDDMVQKINAKLAAQF